MTNSELCRDRCVQFKIEGQTKPFIDHNLQLQLPSVELLENDKQYSHSPIYSHYLGTGSHSCVSQVNETELDQAMNQAKQSYDAWKQMQQRLLDIASKSYQN